MLAENPIHFTNKNNMFGAYPDGMQQIIVGMGCFWGAERIFWQMDGVYVTSVGYAGGHDASPDYKSVCSGRTGHAEVVHVVFDLRIVSFDQILKTFFENHDPTQGNRQGGDVGTQYRSAIYTFSDEDLATAQSAKDVYEAAYMAKGNGKITTEIKPAPTYFPAEDYHQQYLAKNPQGYCGIGGTGVVCPLPIRT